MENLTRVVIVDCCQKTLENWHETRHFGEIYYLYRVNSIVISVGWSMTKKIRAGESGGRPNDDDSRLRAAALVAMTPRRLGSTVTGSPPLC